MTPPPAGAELLAPSSRALDQIAERLLEAQRSRVATAPVRDMIGPTNLAAAYAIQERLTAARLRAGATVLGRKIGLTSSAVQAQLGVDQPDFGVLFDDMLVESGTVASADRLLQPRIEAEVAFVLGADLDAGPLDADQVRASVRYCVAALEIVDSRIAGWDISFSDTVADNASSGLVVLGSERRTLADFSPVDVVMSMSVNGEEVASGRGAACLGDPLEALRWLAMTARGLGQPLLSGQLVLSGALGPMYPVQAGDWVMATISGLGEVSVGFAEPPTGSRDGGHP